MAKPLKTVGIIAAILGAIAVVIATYIVLAGPETYVQSGSQIPQRFVRQIREMGLLESGEEIRHFYSDALIDIRGGFYAATDRKVIVYCDELKPPQIIVRYDEIEDISAEYSGSWIEDSFVTLTITDGSGVQFPLSSEQGGDRRFVNFVKSKIEQNPLPR